MPMPILEMWTDGSVYPNPGPCGFAAIITDGKREPRILHDGLVYGTSNGAELLAIRMGLESLKCACRVTVFTDSQMSVRWLTKQAKAEKTNIRFHVQQIWDLIKYYEHQVTFKHIKGHAGLPLNEQAHELANLERLAAPKYDKALDTWVSPSAEEILAIKFKEKTHEH